VLTWFNYYFWEDMIPIFRTATPYTVNDTPTKISRINGDLQKLFSGRSDSIKKKLVDKLNSGEISETEAWDSYARKVRLDAHSYREVIDSGLYHIGLLEPDGELSELGYKFVDACEKIGDANTGIPLEILRAAYLKNGQYDAFLHYVYQVSEEKFSNDTFAFTRENRAGVKTFDSSAYLDWLYNVFANDLRLIKTTTQRAGGTRKPFQSEIPLLKQLGFLKNNSPFRIGVGLEIDWPQVQNSIVFAQTL
jgi:hypothetical protein